MRLARRLIAERHDIVEPLLKVFNICSAYRS